MEDLERHMFYKGMSDWFKTIEKKSEAFHKKNSMELYDLVFDFWPEMEQYRTRISPVILGLARLSSNKVLQSLECVREYQRLGEQVKGRHVVPKIKTRRTAEKELKMLFEDLPDLNQEKYTKSFWEDYELEIRYDTFFLQTYQKLKEILVEFYFDKLVDLDGNHLRLLNSLLYYLAAMPFASGALKLESEAKEELQNIDSVRHQEQES